MIAKKIALGQFFTKGEEWLKPQVIKFVEKTGCSIAYDPFAGNGDLLSASEKIRSIRERVGLDIDDSLNWKANDSLVSIPHLDDAVIITNPPYIAKNSASRKKIDLSRYFSNSPYDDVYLIALDKMLEAQDNVVAIIPESFVNSSYRQKNRLDSITVLEENPFEDTENPVCVVCFDAAFKEFSEVKVYKNETLVGALEDIREARMKPQNNIGIIFNSLAGWLGLHAVDGTDDKTFIRFDHKENFRYDWETRIKETSRHYTLIDVDVPVARRQDFIERSNRILEEIRKKSCDILLTPFKGNTKSGIRRRRLDFRLARAIMEKAYEESIGRAEHDEYRLF